MSAVVQINAVSTRVKDVPFGVAVSLTNASTAGVTSQKWEVVAYSPDIYGNEPDPANYSGWTLTGKIFSRTQTGSYPAVTFTPDISGNYIVRLTDTTNGDPNLWAIQTAVVRVKDQLSGGYIPAPGENDEADVDRGWSLERNQDLRIQARSLAYGSHVRVVNLTGSTIARGKVCKVVGFTDMHTVGGSAVPVGATVRRERIAKIQVANSSDSDAIGAVYVIVTEPAGILNSGTGYALRNGVFEGVNPSSGAININFSGFTASALVYLNTTGDVVNAPAGSNTVAIGRCIENGSDGDMLFDGSKSGVLTSKFIVQGTTDSQLQSAQFLGSLATGIVKNTTATGVLSIGVGGTDFENPLTFSQGVTRTGNNVTGDYITGAVGNQIWTAGLNANDSLTIRASSNGQPGPLTLTESQLVVNLVPATLPQALGATLDAVKFNSYTVQVSGTGSITTPLGVNYMSIPQPVFNSASSVTILNSATLVIRGAPTYTGAAFITNRYALWIQGQGMRVDGTDDNGNAIYMPGGGQQNMTKHGGAFAFGTDDNNSMSLFTSNTSRMLITGAGQLGYSNRTGAITIPAATSIRFAYDQAVNAATSAVLDNILYDASTVTFSGTIPITTATGVNQVVYQAPTFTNGSVMSVLNAATVTIQNAPIAAGNLTITNPLSFWVQGGKSLFAGTTSMQGTVIVQALSGMLKATTGVVSAGVAGTDYQVPLSPFDTTISFPTPDKIKVNTLSNKFIVQGTTDTMLPNAQFLGALATGLVKNTTTAGVLSIAIAGTDFESALTFTSGLTRVSNTVTNDLFTGKGAAQSVVGATTTGGSLTLSSTAAGSKGTINLGTSIYDENANTLKVLNANTTTSAPTLTVEASGASGIPILHFRGNSTLRAGIRPDTSGGLFQFANGGNLYWLTGGDFATGNVRLKLFTNGNFLVSPAAVSGDPTDVGALFGTSGTAAQTTIVRHTATPASITGASGSVLNAYLWDSVTQQVSAGANITTATGYNFAVFNNPTINTTLNIAVGATLYIKDAPAITGGGSMTTPLSLWVDNGTTRLDGTVIIGTLTGMLKGTSGIVSAAVGGTDFEFPLIFSTGLTRATNTITADLSTGKGASQSVVGGDSTSGSGGSLTLLSTNHTTKGRVLNGTWFALDEVNNRVLIGTQTAGVGAPLTINTTDSGGLLRAIHLTKSGEQDIIKTGGILGIGTSDNQDVAFVTNNIGRLYVKGSGNCVFTNNNVASIATGNGIVYRMDQTVPSGASATLDNFLFDTSTITVSGATNITTAAGFNQTVFKAPVYNGTPTIANAATVTILGAPSGTAPITNPNALWVQAGTSRLAGTVIIGALTGMLKGTSGTVGTANAGVDFESPLTFSTGLTRASNTITSNLSTGVNGGQSVVGDTANGGTLTLTSTLSATKGRILVGSFLAIDEVNARLLIGTQTAGAGAPLTIASSSGSRAILLNQAASQYISKTGGLLLVGTTDSNACSIATSDLQRISADGSGNAILTNRGALGSFGAGIRFGYDQSMSFSSSAVLDSITFDAATATFSGGPGTVSTSTGFNQVVFRAPTITGGSAITVSKAATVAITGAPIPGGSVSITTPSALWLQNGALIISGVDTSARAIFLNQGGQQNIIKHGGLFGIGTDDSQTLALVTNNTTRMSINGSGLFALDPGGETISNNAQNNLVSIIPTTVNVADGLNVVLSNKWTTLFVQRAIYNRSGSGTTPNIDEATTLFIEGEPLTSGAFNITNRYAMHLKNGVARFDAGGSPDSQIVFEAVCPKLGGTFFINSFEGGSYWLPITVRDGSTGTTAKMYIPLYQ